MPTSHLKNKDTTSTILQTFFLGVGGFLLFAIMIALVLTWGGKPVTYEEERAQLRTEVRQSHQEAARKQLDGYEWVDPEAGRARVPLEVGIELAMKTLREKPVAPSGVTAVTEPPPAPDEEPEPADEEIPADELEDPDSEGAEEIEAAEDDAGEPDQAEETKEDGGDDGDES